MARRDHHQMDDRKGNRRLFPLVVILVAIVASSCLPARGILFKSDHKEGKRLKLLLMNGQLEVEFNSYSRYSTGLGGYSLDLGIKVKDFASERHASVDPNEIVILFDGKEMVRRQREGFVIGGEWSNGTMSMAVRFGCIVDLEEIGVNKWGQPLEVDIEIVLNDFLKYDGVPVFIDTIHAVEPYD